MVVALSVATIALAGCGGCTWTATARSNPVPAGVPQADACIRSPRQAPDVDGTFWTLPSDPASGSDGLLCSAGASPSSPRGTFTLIDHDHLLFTGPDGRQWVLLRADRTEVEHCTD